MSFDIPPLTRHSFQKTGSILKLGSRVTVNHLFFLFIYFWVQFFRTPHFFYFTMSTTTTTTTIPPTGVPTPPTTALLAGSAGAFGAGLLGAIWYTQRKQNKRMATEILEGQVPLPASKYTPPQYIPPVLTPAEKIIAKKEASLFAFKTLGYGTLLAWGTAGILAMGVGWYLDVRNVSIK